MDVMNQRRNDIAEFVNREGQITFLQLKEKFPNVSDMTLRTDLKALDEQKLLIRVHGGAKSLEVVSGNDDYINRRFTKNVEEKQEIAKKAVELVHANKTLFMDSGSTTTFFSKVVPNQNNNYFTSSLTCAVELSKLSNVRLYLTGGEVNQNSLSVHGLHGAQYLENVNFETVFIGVTRYSERTGFTCESAADAEMKRSVIAKAEKVVILMDSSKIDKSGTYTICRLKDVDVIVSDSKLPQEFKEVCKEQGVTIL